MSNKYEFNEEEILLNITKKKKKKSIIFPIFIVILIAILTRMCFYGWSIAGEFFDAYEHSVPEVILDEIVLALNNGDYSELLQVASFDVNQFESQNSVVQNIKLDQKANYEYVKDTTNNYYLIRDSIKIGEISLKTLASNNDFELPSYELDTVVFDLTPINAIMLTVPHNSTITINGITPNEDDLLVETNEIVNFSSKYVAYEDVITITGFMTQPEIKVYYNEVELLEENGVYSIELDEQKEEYMGNLALEIAKKYANFTSNDLALEDIVHYFDTTTETYNKVKTYDGKYYNSHSAFTFSDVVIGDVLLLNDNIIEANVSFNYTITSWSGNFDYPSSYTIYFDTSNNKVISLGMN